MRLIHNSGEELPTVFVQKKRKPRRYSLYKSVFNSIVVAFELKKNLYISSKTRDRSRALRSNRTRLKGSKDCVSIIIVISV